MTGKDFAGSPSDALAGALSALTEDNQRLRAETELNRDQSRQLHLLYTYLVARSSRGPSGDRGCYDDAAERLFAILYPAKNAQGLAQAKPEHPPR